MARTRSLALIALVGAVAAVTVPAQADSVILKNGGTVLKGTVDRDNTIVYVFDGLRRVVVRESKIARIEPNAGFRNLETFKLVQPLVVHSGAMPREVLRVEAEPWNDRGRRTFTYWPRPSSSVTMEQAIIELGPYAVKIRGVDGFWQGQLALSQVSRDVVLGILDKIDRQNRADRRRVYSFLVQAEWYAEARANLDQLVADFPDVRDNVESARAAVNQIEAAQLKAEIETRRKAQQPREVAGRLKAFPTRDISSDLLVEVRDQLRRDSAQAQDDASIGDALRATLDRLPTEARKEWKAPLLEVLKALDQAPDAVRDRFVAWKKAEADGSKTDAERFALALSGFAIGADAAVADLAVASTCWKARGLVHDYLTATEPTARAELLEKLDALDFAAVTLPDAAATLAMKKLDVVTRLAQRMPPPLAKEKEGEPPGRVIRHRVSDDSNEAPTEYAVSLPPEYHPLRSYPAIVALHAGGGPESALGWWTAEAQRRGYILIAPEYNIPGRDRSYHYDIPEHAAAELALRDARRRYAIDSDRVFIGGQLVGGDMAWDFGLAHPDLCAGVVVISGDPGKYVTRTLAHTARTPLYVALGDLAPASNEVVFSLMLRPLIARGNDVIYVEYLHRGREDFPEEAPNVFDWMDVRRRDPAPGQFEVVAARDCDVRYYGVVIREFAPGRSIAPEAADPAGKNLNPAKISLKSSKLSNLLNYTMSGVTRRDIWVSPKLIDFKRRLEVRVNGKPAFKGMAKPDLEPLLEDLRLRGDRQQVYWLKVPGA